ncbi:MAG: hypothetical protein QGG15_01150 [Dehalococcoidales bacterium]|jgi:hypothetical protein|nr:hypothetical protein [Dehalococcoidales bacterium]MDP6737628.1 hypothetical protein [Dehalococcoidales bacterium]|tara:strand:- start:585 stop:716 length:132 start_codon:yes stop_codon:yes gene_type:complete
MKLHVTIGAVYDGVPLKELYARLKEPYEIVVLGVHSLDIAGDY